MSTAKVARRPNVRKNGVYLLESYQDVLYAKTRVKVPNSLFLLSGSKVDKHGLQCLVKPLIKSVCLQKFIEFDTHSPHLFA